MIIIIYLLLRYAITRNVWIKSMHSRRENKGNRKGNIYDKEYLNVNLIKSAKKFGGNVITTIVYNAIRLISKGCVLHE